MILIFLQIMPEIMIISWLKPTSFIVECQLGFGKKFAFSRSFLGTSPIWMQMKCRMRVKNVHWDELISEVVFFLKIGKRLSPPTLESGIDVALVTQPMFQHRLNCSELRSMDYYIQILCRFQKCKRKVPPLSPYLMIL